MNFLNKEIKIRRPAAIYKLIAKIHNEKKRNLIRGYAAKQRFSRIDAEPIRSGNSLHDSQIVGALLKGRNGLLNTQQGKKKTSSDLFTMTGFPPIDWRAEISYTIGYVNDMGEAAVRAAHAMKELVNVDLIESDVALQRMLILAKEYGASNYLSYKLAYIRSARDLSATSLALVSQIEDEIEHRGNAGMHFSALENISSKLSLFLVAQRRVSGLVGRVNGEFRKSLGLSNFVPTPIGENDIAGFFLRATESSLIDTLYAIVILFNLSKEFGAVKREFEHRLDSGILSSIQKIIESGSSLSEVGLVTEGYSHDEDGDPSLDLYRVASAFLERPTLAKYRSEIDRVIGVRMLSEIIGEKSFSITDSFNDKKALLSKDANISVGDLTLKLDTFYRTFLFLKFIRYKSNILALTTDEIKFLFENTMALEVLLTEDEIRTLYLTAPAETRSFVAILALALFRTKSIDPDVDFEFRTDFISHVNKAHGGSMVGFIDYLLDDSPQIANYIVGSLDEVTLEKMYTLIKNASEASQIRCEILQAVGRRLNRIEYIIEADAITTRSKVSKLQQYFDSSRMYVDSVSMKKWLDSNPTIATEQYRSLYPKIEARLSSIEDAQGIEKSVLLIQLNDQDEYLVSQIAKDAFEQFCLNTEFGIQSYLGRRIRHNTLDGVTTDNVDAVLRKPEYEVIMSNRNMRRTVDLWLASYKNIIDKLRREQLQFKSSNSLFNSVLDVDESTTKENIRNLTNTLRGASGSELLNDLVIAFCWRQIAPQLESAARHIKTKLLQEAYASIDKHFLGTHGVVEAQMKSELREAVNEVLKKVADWFQVPQTGFVSASVTELCQIILIELSRKNPVRYIGNAVANKYTGISVHRLYDCLAVLLKNAQNHGEEGSEILVDVEGTRIAPSSALEVVTVNITSVVSSDDYLESKTRILAAIDSVEAGIDMVTEGYTGIKKIKFITRGCEGVHTVRCKADDANHSLTLSFSMHLEVSVDGLAGKDD